MADFATKFLVAFIPIFVAIDAVGMVAIFIGLGANVDPKRRQQEAILGILTALGISVGSQTGAPVPPLGAAVSRGAPAQMARIGAALAPILAHAA